MVSTGPDGSSTSWPEGPYDKPWQAAERITFWQVRYAREREGWRITGRLETASPVWVSVQSSV